MTDLDAEINAKQLVLEFFKLDVDKTHAWFNTANPLLGNVSPNQMLKMGKAQRLLKFVKDQLEGNIA